MLSDLFDNSGERVHTEGDECKFEKIETLARKLNESNFEDWIEDLNDLLVVRDLEKYAEPDYVEPQERTERIKYLRTKYLVKNSIDETHLREVKENGLKTPGRIIEYLTRKYQKSNVYKLYNLKKEMAELKMTKDKNAEKVYNEFVKIKDKYEAAGGTMAKVELNLQFIDCFPDESFAAMKASLRARDLEKLSLPELLELIKMQVPKESVVDKTNVVLSTVNKKDGKKIKCFNCGKLGHYKRDCKRKNIKDVECFICHKKGHLARTCRTKEKEKVESHIALKIENSNAETNSTEWIVDSGCTKHICNNLASMVELQKYKDNVKTASGEKFKVNGIGDCMLKSDKNVNVKMTNTLYVPDFKNNLLSVANICDKGYTVIFDSKGCKIIGEKGTTCIEAKRKQNLYVIEGTSNSVMCVETENDDIWHRRLGHPGLNKMKRIIPGYVGKLCDTCQVAKGIRVSHTGTEQNFELMERISADVIGPLPESVRGYKYILNIVEHNTNYGFVKILKNKGEASAGVIEYINKYENKTKKKLKTFLSDNGTEFLTNELEDFLKKKGITCLKTAPYCPQQNGKIERRNRTLVECARTLLNDAKLPIKYWPVAIEAANYLVNLWPDKENCTPYEKLHNRKMNYSHLKKFGCVAYWRQYETRRRNKLTNTCRRLIMVGYTNTTKNYVLLDPTEDEIIVSPNVKFNENEVGFTSIMGIDSDESDELYSFNTTNVTENTTTEVNMDLPQTYNDCKNDAEWIEAMQRELDSLKKLEVFEEINENLNVTTIGTKWVFTRKDSGLAKARLVAKGYVDKHQDYMTYSPVVNYEILRLFLTMITEKNLELIQLDVKTAFLNSDISREAYIEVPEGMNTSAKLLKLKKALYGLSTSPRDWFNCLKTILEEYGLKSFENEICLYKKKCEKEELYVLTYVDDILIAGTTNKTINDFVSYLETKVELRKNSGKQLMFLGMEIERENFVYRISQKRLIKRLAEMYDCHNGKKIQSLPKIETIKSNEIDKSVEKTFRSLIGSLMYIANVTRPDILFYVNYLAQKINTPNKTWLKYAKKVVMYLMTTIDLELRSKKENDNVNEVTTFVDASYAQEESGRSRSGYIIMVNGVPIVWGSKKQSTVACSTMEAELVAIYQSIDKSILVQDLVKEFRCEPVGLRIYEDNLPAIQYIKDVFKIPNKKHLRIKVEYIREKVKEDGIELAYIETSRQLADILTKTNFKTELLEKIWTCGILNQRGEMLRNDSALF